MSLSINILLSLNVLDLLEAETLQPTGGRMASKLPFPRRSLPSPGCDLEEAWTI